MQEEKIFIEYEPIETAWVPINGKNYMYVYCLWVAGSFKGKGVAKKKTLTISCFFMVPVVTNCGTTYMLLVAINGIL